MNPTTLKAEYTVKTFVAISKCLDDESTRFIGTFKREQKLMFNILLETIKHFNNTVKANMPIENIEDCEKMQDYLHNFIYTLMKEENKKDIHIFAALCKCLKIIYYKYIQTTFNHKDKDRFISLLLLAEGFSKSIESNEAVNEYFKNFCITLIEGKEFITKK